MMKTYGVSQLNAETFWKFIHFHTTKLFSLPFVAFDLINERVDYYFFF